MSFWSCYVLKAKIKPDYISLVKKVLSPIKLGIATEINNSSLPDIIQYFIVEILDRGKYYGTTGNPELHEDTELFLNYSMDDDGNFEVRGSLNREQCLVDDIAGFLSQVSDDFITLCWDEEYSANGRTQICYMNNTKFRLSSITGEEENICFDDADFETKKRRSVAVIKEFPNNPLFYKLLKFDEFIALNNEGPNWGYRTPY